MTPRVHAVCVGAASDDGVRTLLAEQTYPVDAATAAARPSDRDELLAATPASAETWLWMLDAGVSPDATALEHLVRHMARGPAVVLTSLVTTPGGEPSPSDLPRPFERDPEGAVAGLADGVVRVRASTFASTLISAAAIHRHGAPVTRRYGPFAPLELTARMLAGGEGWLVPASRAVRRVPAASGSMRQLVAMRRSGTWTRGDMAEALNLRFGPRTRWS